MSVDPNSFKFITQNDVKKMPFFHGVYIYGLPKEVDIIEKSIGKEHIINFVDTYKNGKNSRYDGISVIGPIELAKKYKGEYIIIASSRYYIDIIWELEKNNVNAGNERVFIWDNDFLFHFDNRTISFIRFLNGITCKDKKNDSYNGEILIPIDNYHELHVVRYAFLSDYFAQKYKAEIKAYCRFGFHEENLSIVKRKMYESFGVRGIIGECYNGFIDEIESIVEELWKKLYSWKDWNDITIYGIHFGTTMVRDYFRRYLPIKDMRDKALLLFLKQSVSTIVFWKNYIDTHNVCVILMGDGTNWDGYIRDIAVTKGIPAYSVATRVRKLSLDYAENTMYQYFDDMWEQLNEDEKEYGVTWAKKRIAERISGDSRDVLEVDRINFAFSNSNYNERVLMESDKCKVMICPHSFEEDCYWYGEHIFDNNYYSWLYHLGELSQKTPELEWYIKQHPSATRRDYIIIRDFLNEFPNIIPIKKEVNPIQLKREGIRFAFTESGTIGHEYPAIGINVINAGVNPHDKFDFCINPRTKEEFDNLVLGLHNMEYNPNLIELYKFYAMKYLYYDWNAISDVSVFGFTKDQALSRRLMVATGHGFGSWQYDEYLSNLTDEKETINNIKKKMPEFVKCVDNWRDSKFYKREIIREII